MFEYSLEFSQLLNKKIPHNSTPHAYTCLHHAFVHAVPKLPAAYLTPVTFLNVLTFVCLQVGLSIVCRVQFERIETHHHIFLNIIQRKNEKKARSTVSLDLAIFRHEQPHVQC